MTNIRLGTVPFFNSKPLIYAIEKGLVQSNIEISYYVPSQLTLGLNNRAVDIALIPVAELLKNPSLKIFPDISISSFGPVDSVVLLAQKDIEHISTVALDKRSRSSSALMKIILEKFYMLSPEYVYREIDEGFLREVDSGMLIGDAGLHAKFFPEPGFKVYDLGQLWTEKTGLPFVYAVFAYRKENEEKIGPVKDVLLEAKRIGISMIDEIVAQCSQQLGLSHDICSHYLSESIKYDLGKDEIAAIKLFGEYLQEYDIDIRDSKHSGLFENLNI